MTDDEKIARCVQLADEIAAAQQSMKTLAMERHDLIRQLRRSGFSLRKLAARLNISYPRVQELEKLP